MYSTGIFRSPSQKPILVHMSVTCVFLGQAQCKYSIKTEKMICILPSLWHTHMCWLENFQLFSLFPSSPFLSATAYILVYKGSEGLPIYWLKFPIFLPQAGITLFKGIVSRDFPPLFGKTTRRVPGPHINRLKQFSEIFRFHDDICEKSVFA